jgi:hypothetical protein
MFRSGNIGAESLAGKAQSTALKSFDMTAGFANGSPLPITF